MKLSSEYMADLKKRAGADLIESLVTSYNNRSLTDALFRADAGRIDIKAELNSYAIASLITAIAEASGAKVELEEFLQTSEEDRLDAMVAVAKWGNAAVEIRMRELAAEDFDESIKGE